MDEIITEERVDGLIDWIDRHSKKLAIIALALNVGYVILPALYKIIKMGWK